MNGVGSLELTQARVMARHGQRVDEATWHRIEVQRDLVPLLELARGTALRPWLVGVAPDSAAHRVDHVLLGHGRATVAEVANWVPEDWQSAVAWWGVWPELGTLQHLARGGTPPAWLHDEPAYADLLAAAPGARAAALAGGPWAALAPAWTEPDHFAAAWANEWQRRWPAAPAEDRAALAALSALLVRHAQSFVRAPAVQGWPLRGALREGLVTMLRRVALQPAVAFIHLALCALDLERLRGELQRRVLFPHWKGA